jgi:hypothetical protein
VVRRIAAECLLGGRIHIGTWAREHGFGDVLAAEEQVRKLAKQIPRGAGRDRYDATKAMIALGRNAVWALHLLSHDDDEAVSLSAIYALQEIGATCVDVPPAWLGQIQTSLEKKVSFELVDASLEAALQELSELAGVEIRPPERDSYLATPISLRVTDTPLKLGLEWVAKLVDCELVYTKRWIQLEQMRFACGVAAHWVDVRDLEVEKGTRDWAAELNQNALGDDGWIGVPEMGTWLENHGGLLMIMVPSCSLHKPNPGREKLAPIFTYLETLRKRRQRVSGAHDGDEAGDE